MIHWTYIFAIGAAQGLLLALTLWRRQSNPAANRILAIWLLIISADLAIRALYIAESSPELFKWFQFTLFFPFLYGSLFFLYVRTLVNGLPPRRWILLHLSGFLLVVLLNMDLVLMSGAELRQVMVRSGSQAEPLRFLIFDLALYLYCLSYVLAALKKILDYRHAIANRLSNTDGIELGWLYVMAVCQVIIWLIAIVQWVLPLEWLSHWTIYGAVTVWILITGYFSMRQAAIAKQPADILRPPKTITVSDERFPEVWLRIEKLMQEDTLYLKPALTIADLAKSSGYPEYLVSKVINHHRGLSFRDFINTQRIEHAKAKLTESGHSETILDIAYDAGFTSKSTFNSAFKRVTGQTPSTFRQAHATVSNQSAAQQ